MKDPASNFVSGKSIDIFSCLGLNVNQIQIEKFQNFVPCVNLGKKEYQMEICIYKDESRRDVEIVKFSNKDIKNCVFNNKEKTVNFKVIVKNLEIELLLDDRQKIFRRNICRRFLRSNEENTKFVNGDNILFMEQAVFMWLYRYDFSIVKFKNMLEHYMGKEKEKILIELLVRGKEKEIFLLGPFLKNHKCQNSACAGFSFWKCTACMKAHYCNLSCQLQDFEEHRLICDSLAKDHKVQSEVPIKRLEELIKDCTNSSVKVMSPKAFMKKTSCEMFNNNIRQMNDVQIRLLIVSWLEDLNLKSSIVDKIVNEKTYLTLLENKLERKQRRREQKKKREEAMKEVD